MVVDGIMSVFGSLFAEGFGPRTLDIFSGTMHPGKVGRRIRAHRHCGRHTRMLTDTGFRRSVLDSVHDDEGLAGFWSWCMTANHRRPRAPLPAHRFNKLRQLLLRPALMRMLDQRDGRFRLRDLYRQSAIVLVPLNEAQIGAGTADARLPWWSPTYGKRPGTSRQSPTRRRARIVYIDEAPWFRTCRRPWPTPWPLSRSMGVGWFWQHSSPASSPKSCGLPST